MLATIQPPTRPAPAENDPVAKARNPKDRGTIREAIRREIERRGLTGYRLVQLLEGKVSRTAVYRFLSTEGATMDVRTAEEFLKLLDLDVVSRS